jgi:glycosyltransferase involved in cell wall biosynthesis
LKDRSDTEALVVMCGPLAGLSGGDMHALKLVQRWNERRPGAALLLAPDLMRPKLPPGVEPRLLPVRTPFDRFLKGLVSYAVIVILRAIRVSLSAPPARVTIASSHFFQDVIPCVVHRLRHRSMPAAYVYHLVEDMDRPPSLRSRLSVAAERFSIGLLRRAKAVVFVDNEQARRSLERAGLEPGRIFLTQNAYDPPDSLPARSGPDEPVIAFTGRFTAEKGIWEMLVLARELARRMPAARIAMLGEGPLRTEFLARLQDEGLTNVTAPGFVSEEEKWATLRSASLFAAPSREEGWGIAVGEALRAELPAVVCDLPAYEHFGDLVQRVPTGDEAAFVEEVIGLLADPDQLADLSRQVARGAGRLPTWQQILDSEIERLGSLASDGR